MFLGNNLAERDNVDDSFWIVPNPSQTVQSADLVGGGNSAVTVDGHAPFIWCCFDGGKEGQI